MSAKVYPYIRAWCNRAGSSSGWTQLQVQAAEAAGADERAIYFDGSDWVTIDEVGAVHTARVCYNYVANHFGEDVANPLPMALRPPDQRPPYWVIEGMYCGCTLYYTSPSLMHSGSWTAHLSDAFRFETPEDVQARLALLVGPADETVAPKMERYS